MKKGITAGLLIASCSFGAVASNESALALLANAESLPARTVQGSPGSSTLEMYTWVPDEKGDGGSWVATDQVNMFGSMRINVKVTFNPDAQGIPGYVYVAVKGKDQGAYLTSAGWQGFSGGMMEPYAEAVNGLPATMSFTLLNGQTPCSLGTDGGEFYVGYGLMTSENSLQARALVTKAVKHTPEHIVNAILTNDGQKNGRYWKVLELPSCPVDHGHN